MLDDAGQNYLIAMGDVAAGYQALRPPRRISVSQGAAETLVFAQPGTKGGPWDADETPYMVEPMDMLASRRHESVIFAGPARTGKTGGLLLGWAAHTIVNDPGDMLFIQMTQDKAREFSKTDIDRMLRHSTKLHPYAPTSHDDNTHDKMFRHGMWLRVAWPTVSNVSGSTYRFVAITDLDRIKNKENVDGEGPLFELGKKRIQTYGSRGKILVESSPGEPLIDPAWRPATQHEAPPVGGILGLYNLSDRRRLYWRCPHCNQRFEPAPGLGLFNLPDEQQLLDEIRTLEIDTMSKDFGSRIICPSCSSPISVTEKRNLNHGGVWISEAEILGRAPSSPSAGYWMGGLPAAYQKWPSLVHRYLAGLLDFSLTGSEETLKTTTNTDQGTAYMSMHLREAKNSARSPLDRSEDIPRYVVPDWTRCVVAAVDVQGGTRPRFVVQVHAVGAHFEQQLVNRFTIFESRRPGVSGEPDDYAPLDPAAYREDWDRITEEVVRSTYRTNIEDREIKVMLTVVDTGGEDGVTDKAYDYYRRMRKAGLHTRIMLYKGQGARAKNPAEIRESLVGLRKDVPLYICDSNLLADRVHAGLQREAPGPGYYHLPKPRSVKNPDGWITQAFYDELKAEVRQEDGTWKPIRARNESFDLSKMILAGLLRLGMDRKSFWIDRTPDWAAPLAENREVVTVADRRDMKANAALPVEQVPEARPAAGRKRRVAHSGLR